MTNTTPTDLQARMEKLVRDMETQRTEHSDYATRFCYRNHEDARAIVTELPKPIDPDVLAVREILAAIATMSHGYIRGDYDRTPEFENALTAYRRIKAERA